MKPTAIVPAVAALLVLSAVAGFAAPSQPSDAADLDTGPVAAQSSPADAATGSASGSSAAPSGSDAGSDRTAPENFTRLYVDADHPYLQLKPGESDEYTVTVENADDEAVSLDPHVYVPPAGGPVLEASWVTIDGPDRLDAGEEAEFDVSVSVPDDADIGHYGGEIAFTDETVTYPGRPARPVHAAHVRVEVWREPTVEIDSRTYVNGQVEAGETLTREIAVENTGDEPVPVSPELADERRICHGDCGDQFQRSWLDVDAPSQIDPGETATVSVAIAPPEDVDRGRYRAQLDLGLKDPNRAEQDTHWQTVDLNVEVWRQPDAPFETTFDVSERTEEVELTLTPRSNPVRATDGSDEPADFEVELVGPDGNATDVERVRVSDRGFVDLSGDHRRTAGEDGFAVRDGGQEFVYRLDDPAAGEWTLRVMPENTIGFNYEVTRNEAG